MHQKCANAHSGLPKTYTIPKKNRQEILNGPWRIKAYNSQVFIPPGCFVKGHVFSSHVYVVWRVIPEVMAVGTYATCDSRSTNAWAQAYLIEYPLTSSGHDFGGVDIQSSS